MKIDSAHAHRMTPQPSGGRTGASHVRGLLLLTAAGEDVCEASATCRATADEQTPARRVETRSREARGLARQCGELGPAQSARHRYLLTGPSSRRGCLLLESPPLLTPPVVPFKFSYADEHQTNLVRELRTSQRLRFELRSYSKPTRLFFFFF